MQPDPFNPDLHGYYLMAQAALTLAAVYTAGWLVTAFRAVVTSGPLPRLVQALLLALLVCLPLRSLARAAEPLSFASLVAPEVMARAFLDRLPPHAVALTSDFSSVFLLWGAQAAEQARPDVTVVHRNFLPLPGWVERAARFHPELEGLMRRMREPEGSLAPGELCAGRPLRVEPYHNLGSALALQLRPDGLLHRLDPHAALPQEAQPLFWEEVYAQLSEHDLRDPQTRRYLFWQHVLQGQQYRLLGAPRAAFQEYRRALILAPGNPEVLGFCRELVARWPEGWR